MQSKRRENVSKKDGVRPAHRNQRSKRFDRLANHLVLQQTVAPHLRISSGQAEGSKNPFPSLAMDQGFVSSRSCGRTGAPCATATRTARRILRCDAALSDFSDSAVVIPLTGVLRRDRLMSFLECLGSRRDPCFEVTPARNPARPTVARHGLTLELKRHQSGILASAGRILQPCTFQARLQPRPD